MILETRWAIQMVSGSTHKAIRAMAWVALTLLTTGTKRSPSITDGVEPWGSSPLPAYAIMRNCSLPALATWGGCLIPPALVNRIAIL